MQNKHERLTQEQRSIIAYLYTHYKELDPFLVSLWCCVPYETVIEEQKALLKAADVHDANTDGPTQLELNLE